MKEGLVGLSFFIKFIQIGRAMKDYDTIWNTVFPEYWGMLCYIYHEFCGSTRLHLTEILE